MLAEILGSVALRWTCLLVFAWVLTRTPRFLPANARHLVWVLTLGGLLLLPLVQLGVPDWALPGFTPPTWSAVWGTQDSASPAMEEPRRPGGAGLVRGSTPDEPAAPRIDARPGLFSAAEVRFVLGWAWAAVAAGLLAFWGLGLLAARRMEQRGTSAAPSTLLAAADHAARDLGLSRSFQLLVGERQVVPMTWGLWRPVVLVPGDWSSWSSQRLKTVLLHELAHIRRRDAWSQALSRLACALFWFHPGVWVAARRLCVEAEKASDDAVVRAGLEASDYAGHLLALARSFAAGPVAAVSIGMARPGGLEPRIRAMLDEGRPRIASRSLRLSLVMGAATLILGLAGLRTSAALSPSDWLRTDTLAGSGEVAWRLDCGSAGEHDGSLCESGTRRALELLRESGRVGTVVIQEVASGEIATYASTTGQHEPVPLVTPASLAKLALAGLWWEHGLGDVERPCPGQWNPDDGPVVKNHGGRDLGVIVVPEQMVALSCNTAAASMAGELLERMGPERSRERYESFGFGAPTTEPRALELDGEFWGPKRDESAAWTLPPRPFAGLEPSTWNRDWALLAAGQGSMATTPLHISRFLQGIGNEGLMVNPRPPGASPPGAMSEISGRTRRILSPETASKLRQTMAHVVSDGTGQAVAARLAGSEWGLEGKTGSAHGRDGGEQLDGWFAGLAHDEGGEPRYTVVVWLEGGGPGGGRPGGLAAEMTRFLAGAVEEELP